MNLRMLNTKVIGYAGVGTFLCSLLAYGPFQEAISKTVTSPQAVQYISLAGVISGFVLAYYGEPHTVDSSSQAVDQTKGQ